MANLWGGTSVPQSAMPPRPRADLSLPLLPPAQESSPTMSKLMRKAMSYPFSQQEVLAEATAQAGEGHDAFSAFSSAARRLAPVDINELIDGARAVEESSKVARAAVYKRVRPDALVIPEEGPSWQQVSLIIATVLVGAGVLGLPFALRQAGWIAIVLIIGATAVAAHTAKMLVWSFNSLNERKGAPGGDVGKGFVETYDQLSEELGGPLAGMLMKALTVLECYGTAVCYVVLHATSWPHILDLPPLVYGVIPAPIASVAVWAILMAPLILVRVRRLAVFGSLGLIAIATLLVVSFVAPALSSQPAPADAACAPLDSSVQDSDDTGDREVIRLEGLGVALGLVLFCFGGHATLPDIYARMTADQRPHFDSAVNVGVFIAGTLYALLGAAGYYYYGGCAADALTLNLMHSSPILGSVATVCVLANTFLSFPNFCAPVVRILTEQLHTADAVASLEADVVPPTEEELYRAGVASKLEAISTKLDAVGAVLAALAPTLASKSALSLPRDALHTLRAPLAMAAGSVTASSSTGSELNDSFRRGTPDPRAGSSRDTLFETMSTRSLLVLFQLAQQLFSSALR